MGAVWAISSYLMFTAAAQAPPMLSAFSKNFIASKKSN
jgi:hypothetical protein